MKTSTLLCLCFLGSSYSQAVDDVYEYLWEQNKDIANKTIGLDFLRQMENGSLQAERYVNFTIQDIGYLLEVTKMLKKMSAKVFQPSDIKDFMKGRYSSYKRYADIILKQYFFKGEPPIEQTPAMKKYLAYYRNLMDNEEPLYFAVGLLPCARLWVWLAKNLNTPSTNAYYTWKVENMGGHPEKHYRALLNKYLNTTKTVEKANAIFRAQMQNEHDFFFSS
uniref:Si:ch1073-67j19.2 n=1 Tax=Cyprinus carpio TaxID=7962 RepID=A0A8C2AWG2_CYPCA